MGGCLETLAEAVRSLDGLQQSGSPLQAFLVANPALAIAGYY
jgi:hypothetical protein